MWENKEKYLAAAINVVYVVKDKVPFGASNRFADFVESYDRNHEKIGGHMGGMTAFLPLMTGANRVAQMYDTATGKMPEGKIERMRYIANLTVKIKAGNCNEQSIVAFMELYDRGIRPLSWVYMDNGRHAFVVIGRKPGSGNKPENWGDDCVVCDPWARDAYYLPADSGGGILQTKWRCPTATAEFEVE